MIYYRCRCRAVCASYCPPGCVVCPACGSGLASSPEYDFSSRTGMAHSFVDGTCTHCKLTPQAIFDSLLKEVFKPSP